MFLGSLAAGPKELLRTSVYPTNNNEYFFKPICCLAISGDVVYGVENLSNKVIALKLNYPKLEYSRDIGRPGQGPGDLLYPIAAAISGDEIIIKEASAFSFFGIDGSFRSKFRAYSNNSAFFFLDNKLYWLNPSIKRSHLIEVYLKNGLMTSTIGDKSVMPQAMTEDPIRVDSIFEGIVFPYDNSVFYISARFGSYCRYSFAGDMLVEGDIGGLFGARGDRIKRFNTDVLIYKEIRKAEDSGYPKPLIFEAASVLNEEIFFMGSRYDPTGEGKTYLDLKRVKLDSMSTIDDYVVIKKGFCRIDSFIIFKRAGNLVMILSITDFGEGHFLELYEIRE